MLGGGGVDGGGGDGGDDEAEPEAADDEVDGEVGVGEGSIPALHEEEGDGGEDEAEGGREPVAEPGHGQTSQDPPDGDSGGEADQPEATFEGVFAHDGVGY